MALIHYSLFIVALGMASGLVVVAAAVDHSPFRRLTSSSNETNNTDDVPVSQECLEKESATHVCFEENMAKCGEAFFSCVAQQEPLITNTNFTSICEVAEPICHVATCCKPCESVYKGFLECQLRSVGCTQGCPKTNSPKASKKKNQKHNMMTTPKSNMTKSPTKKHDKSMTMNSDLKVNKSKGEKSMSMAPQPMDGKKKGEMTNAPKDGKTKGETSMSMTQVPKEGKTKGETSMSMTQVPKEGKTKGDNSMAMPQVPNKGKKAMTMIPTNKPSEP